MKRKKITYLLVLCVVALWGIIFYRIYLVASPKEDPVMQTSLKKPEYFKMVSHLTDQVTLDFNYRDPFASSQMMTMPETEIKLPIKPQIAQFIPPKPQVNWTGITYNGYINNTSNKQKLAILIVNGKEFMLAEGQNLNGIKLLKYAGDSIKVQYQNELKYLKLK